jgi:hypothetical protein
LPTQGTETSHYLEERKATATPSVAASERGPAQTPRTRPGGVVGPNIGVTKAAVSGRVLERSTTDGDSPVRDGGRPPVRHLSRAGHVKAGSNLRGPSRKAKYSLATDSETSSASERWEEPPRGEDSEPETTCLQAVRARLPARVRVMACLLHNDPATYRRQPG